MQESLTVTLDREYMASQGMVLDDEQWQRFCKDFDWNQAYWDMIASDRLWERINDSIVSATRPYVLDYTKHGHSYTARVRFNSPEEAEAWVEKQNEFNKNTVVNSLSKEF